MARWVDSSILWIPLVVVALMGGVGLYAYQELARSTRAQLERELSTILEADVEALRIWVENEKAAVMTAAASTDLGAPVLELKELMRTARDVPAELSESAWTRQIRERLAPALEMHHLENFLVFDSNAVVLADVDGALAGRRLAVRQAPFKRLFEGGPSFVRPPQNVKGEDEETFRQQGAVFYAVAPIRGHDGEVVALLAFEVGHSTGFSEILQVARMGETGETYAFDAEGQMLTQSRFIEQLVSLGLLPPSPEEQRAAAIQIRDPGGNLVEGFVPELPVRARPLTRMVAHAVSQGDGIDLDGYRDYRGVEVVGAWRWLPQLELGVASEIDRAEAYTGLDTLRTTFAALGAALFLGAAGLLVYSIVVGRLQKRFDKARRLGRYEIIEKIGEGGMGKVYRAKHALLRRPTAIKLLEAAQASREAVERFEREVQASSSLTHPNTISIFDYGRTPEGTFYYAMEFLDGITIGDLVDEDGPQPEARVVHIMRQAAASLAEAHAAGLIHRDLKPSNVMLCERGGLKDFAKVLDFGLVRGEDRRDELTVTKVESLTGTPLYLSPEALEAPETVSAASDVYQLGAIAYFLLTGRHVFSGETLVEVLSQHLNKPPIPPSEALGKPVTPELERLVLHCLEKAAYDRPASGGELLEALETCEFAGSWSQADARAWWEAFEARDGWARVRSRATSSHPTGLQVDFDRSSKFR